MAEALTVLQCVALAALALAALSAARWFWKASPTYRRRGLADRQSKAPPEPEEPVPYVAIRPGRMEPPKKPKKWLQP